MNVSVTRSALLEAVRSVSGASDSNNHAEHLEHVVLTARASGVLELVSTDLERAAGATISATVSEPGVATASASKLLGLLGLLPGGSAIDLASRGGRLALSVTGSKRYSFCSFDVVEWPEHIRSTTEPLFGCPADDLRGAIDATRFAMATPGSLKTPLAGICLKIEAGCVTAVATDAARLSRYSFSVNYDGPVLSCVVPRDSVRALTRWLKECHKPVSVALDARQLRFDCADTWFQTQLLNEGYPDVEPLISKPETPVCSISRSGFAMGLNQIEATASPKNRDVTLTLTDSELVFDSVNTQGEDGHAVIAASARMEPGGVGRFAIRLLTQAVNAMDCDWVDISWMGDDRAFIIRPADGVKAMHLIMPFRPQTAESEAEARSKPTEEAPA